jgi:hypothetical protein
MTLADKLRPYVQELMAGAKGGDQVADRVITLYRMHCSCPSDPGAPALCEAAFDEWKANRNRRRRP